MITVVDSICGSGKTSWAIEKIKEPFSKERYIYVTPYLEEVERIIESTKASDFHFMFDQPDNKNSEGSKIEGIKKLLAKGDNIVCTHRLFQLFDEEIRNSIKESGYTLILDEVVNVIEKIKITKDDINMLVETGRIEVNDKDGSVRWMNEEYQGKFIDIKQSAKTDSLFLFSKEFMFWTLNKKAFESFEKIYILTYLFDGQIQKYYFDLHKMEYIKKTVVKNEEGYELVDYDPLLENREVIKERVDIYKEKGKSKSNTNFIEGYESEKKEYKNILSSTWIKRSSRFSREQLGKNVRSYFTVKKVNVETSYWTTLKDYAESMSSDKSTYYKIGYKRKKKHNFVSLNIRATNEYKDCTACAYLYNRFMNPVEKNFFNFHGVEVNEDLLAISDLIQFLFRGTIRNNDNSILSVYLPSDRMRELLNKYFNYEI